MPKRSYSSSDDEIDYLRKKLRKLERTVHASRPKNKRRKRRRRRRSRTRSRSRSRSPPPARSYSVSSRDSQQHTPYYEQREPEVTVLEGPECSENVQVNEVERPPNEGDTVPVTDTTQIENTDNPVPELDNTILEILGDDPTSMNTFGSEIHKDLSIRLQHWVSNGVSKETKKEFKEKYLIPSNCKLISAPALNAEIKAAISEVVAKRDKAIEIKQSQLAGAIVAVSQALTRLLSSAEKDTDLIKTLTDTCKILCDCQYSDSLTRRNFVLSTLKKDIKDQVQNSKVDSLLFGENFAETIKTAKAINKSGAELKAAPLAMKPQSTIKKPMPGSSRNLNWKTPFPTRRQPEARRTKEPATSVMTKNRPLSSSRPSHHRAPHTSSRR